jgi:hypothetical protein
MFWVFVLLGAGTFALVVGAILVYSVRALRKYARSVWPHS